MLPKDERVITFSGNDMEPSEATEREEERLMKQMVMELPGDYSIETTPEITQPARLGDLEVGDQFLNYTEKATVIRKTKNFVFFKLGNSVEFGRECSNLVERITQR